MIKLYTDAHIFKVCRRDNPFELVINEEAHSECETAAITKFQDRVIVDICTCPCHTVEVYNGKR